MHRSGWLQVAWNFIFFLIQGRNVPFGVTMEEMVCKQTNPLDGRKVHYYIVRSGPGGSRPGILESTTHQNDQGRKP